MSFLESVFSLGAIDDVVGGVLIALFFFGVVFPLCYIVVLNVVEVIHNVWFHRICKRFSIDARSRLFRVTEAVADVVDSLLETLFDWHVAVLMAPYHFTRASITVRVTRRGCNRAWRNATRSARKRLSES